MKKDTTKSSSIRTALLYMQDLFGDYPLSELQYHTPFQLLVAVIMSAQTTDKQVNKVNEHFFRVVTRPEDVVALGESGVGELIKTVGLWKSKTTNLVKMAQMITTMKVVAAEPHYMTGQGGEKKDIKALQWQYTNAQTLYEEWGYWIPDTIEELMKLPGVGIKTAKVVLYILYGQRRVAVDTHVHRVMNRLGFVNTKTPDQTSVQLEKLIPDDLKDLAHRVIIYFGRYWCMARNPTCLSCRLQKRCVWFRKEKKKL